MTKEEFQYLENMTSDQIQSYLGLNELIEDDYTLIQLCIERYIKPNYEDFTFNEAFVKTFKEANKIQNEELASVFSRLRDMKINEILDIKKETTKTIDDGDDFFSDFPN